MRRVSYAEPVRRNPPGGKQETVQTISATVPHPVRLGPDHHSRGMTATGSHIDFGFTARSTTLQGKALAGATLIAPTAPHPSLLRKATFPQGKALLCPGGLFRRFLPLNIRYLAGGACLARQVRTVTACHSDIYYSFTPMSRICFSRPTWGRPSSGNWGKS